VLDATILIPTHRHVALLPHALESALDQESVSVEVLVVGDGVEDATREILARHADDPRVRFFDFPKGPRNGEAYRHEVLLEARGRVVAYLSDDDLLLPDHVTSMVGLLEDADFTHSATATLEPGGLIFHPWDFGRPEFVELMRSGRGSVGLTGAAHTLAAYLRLPHGWRTAPDGIPTDRHMWLQWFDQPWCRSVSSRRLTHLKFPDPAWRSLPEDERAAELAGWLARSREPGFRRELDELLAEAILRSGEDYRLYARKLELRLDARANGGSLVQRVRGRVSSAVHRRR
jgi:GalNAc5-diNAcBac-PP-undecaprenol beta-1,3-glucosyltransferase